MEKFSQYRDRGTGIAPFIPFPSTSSLLSTPLSLILTLFRLPFLLTLWLTYLLLPLPTFLNRTLLWSILLVSGVWWIDLQVEGVKRGTLSKYPKKLPGAGSVVVSTWSSPLDALYLAAMFDPVFCLPVPGTSLVRRVTLPTAILSAFAAPTFSTNSTPPPNTTTIQSLLSQNPHRIIAVFPEATTTNGRALLQFQPCLGEGLSAPIFPVSLRYTPASIVTPIPNTHFSFLYRLLGTPTHAIKVRIAEVITEAKEVKDVGRSSSSETITLQTMLGEGGREGEMEEKVGEALSRIGRIRRVGLSYKEKVAFWKSWRTQK